jgi:2-iminoacetate synthase
MGFFAEFEKLDRKALFARLYNATSQQVERAIDKDQPTPEDFPALFSPAADSFVEELAQKSAAITERRFGKVIVLYAPLYLSNECVNHCVYCGFSRKNQIKRVTLDIEEALTEADKLYQEGFRHVLLVSGEAPRHVGYHYLTAAIKAMGEKFSSVAIEVYPMEADGYKRMTEAGADGLVLYQETYDPKLYAELHPAGPKRDFAWRLDGPDRGGESGFRSLGIGALLGLSDWRQEALLMALHGRYLTKKYWRSRVAVSFPRMRSAEGAFAPANPVSDRAVVQMMCALRLVLPDAEAVLSTREPSEFRDNLIGLGVTRMSAGSKTSPGAYCGTEEGGKQFAIVDDRSPIEVSRTILARGHEPVWKDFDRSFLK